MDTLTQMQNPIRKRRAKKGLNQIELAKKCGVTDETIRRWEKGKTEILDINLERLSRVLKVKSTTLFEELQQWRKSAGLSA
jgi:transcriptional regulator with XRE-family HTH domain